MRLAENGQPIYKFDELLKTARVVAIDELQFELYIDAVNQLSMEKYCLPQKENLEKKGFVDVSFYRFFVDEEKIKIDYTFLYVISNETIDIFKDFAKKINFKFPIIISDFIKHEDLLIEIMSKKYKYNDIDDKKSNISIEAVYSYNNISIKTFIDELTQTFESYYDYILQKMYIKVKKDIALMTNKEAFSNSINEYEFYSNGMIY